MAYHAASVLVRGFSFHCVIDVAQSQTLIRKFNRWSSEVN
jgi:hypothetical protein